MRNCEACGEHIEEYDNIILTDDDEVYHEECCNIYSMGYAVYSNGRFVGETEGKAMKAWFLLGEDEYEGVAE